MVNLDIGIIKICFAAVIFIMTYRKMTSWEYGIIVACVVGLNIPN